MMKSNLSFMWFIVLESEEKNIFDLFLSVTFKELIYCFYYGKTFTRIYTFYYN